MKEENYLQHVSLVLTRRIIFLRTDEFDLHFFPVTWCWAVAFNTFAEIVGFCFFPLSSNYTELLFAKPGLAKRTSTNCDVKGFSNIFFGLKIFFFGCFLLWAKVILCSVLAYRKHQYLKASFAEKLSRKSAFAICEALL